MENNLTQPQTRLRIETAQVTIWGLFLGLIAVLVAVAQTKVNHNYKKKKTRNRQKITEKTKKQVNKQ